MIWDALADAVLTAVLAVVWAVAAFVIACPVLVSRAVRSLWSLLIEEPCVVTRPFTRLTSVFVALSAVVEAFSDQIVAMVNEASYVLGAIVWLEKVTLSVWITAVSTLADVAKLYTAPPRRKMYSRLEFVSCPIPIAGGWAEYWYQAVLITRLTVAPPQPLPVTSQSNWQENPLVWVAQVGLEPEDKADLTIIRLRKVVFTTIVTG